VRGDKLLHGQIPDPFPRCGIGSGHARLRGNMHQTPSPTGTAVVCYMNQCAINKRGCTAVVSRLCIITVLRVRTAVIHKLYVRMHLVCHQLLPSSSVPHAHTAIIVAGGQFGFVIGVVAYGA